MRKMIKFITLLSVITTGIILPKNQGYAQIIKSSIAKEKKVLERVAALPEVQQRSKEIKKLSNGKTDVTLMISAGPDNYIPYYQVNVNGGPPEYKNYYQLAVDPKTYEIFFYDASTNKQYSVAEWRKIKSHADAPVKPVRIGAHAFTIQWISFNNDNPGSVNIKLIGDDEYSIEGAQRDPKTKEYVTIKGTFLNKGRTLKFNGTISSKINSINGGKPCERTGLQLFKASGTRKYWRLQQMLNCDGVVTDYIDIFF